MRMLVTGGAGFIGSHVIHELLAQGHDVVVMDDLSSGNRKRVPRKAKFIKADVSDRKKWSKIPAVDGIFHFAAQIDVRKSVDDPHFDAQSNILGTINVLDFAKQVGAKKVVFSSSGGAMYGDASVVPTPESYAALPMSPYGLSKWCAERYIDLFSRLHNVPCVVLRYGNVYGPGQSGSKESGVIAIFTERAARGEDMTVFGDGEQTRDFVYVKDVVSANLAAWQHAGNDLFNIGTGTETSINQLVSTLEKMLAKKLNITKLAQRPGEVKRSCLDISHAAAKLNWKPAFDLAAGLKETLEAIGND